MRKPDEVRELADGSTELIRYRRTPRPSGDRSRMREIVESDGTPRELWHEVLNPFGEVIHQHPVPIRRRKRDDSGG